MSNVKSVNVFGKKIPLENFLIFGILVPLIFIVGVSVFIFNDDGGITGAQALGLEGFWFWFFSIGGLLGGSYGIYKVIDTEKNKPGVKTSPGLVVFIVSVLLILAPWGKACTDKTNGGVTAPNYKSATK
jgi:hypothetical protein